MMTKNKMEAQNPLILRSQRLIEAFAKSDDERDFYLDRWEGFIIYVDLNKLDHDLKALEKELSTHGDRYCMIPKLTFYETKKIMEGFVTEKVYDIDTKEKLLDIIQSKEARQNFLEFIYDHHSELEKWHQYYQERSRIRIIEWLRNSHFHFVFEEDLDVAKSLIEKVKRELFAAKVGKDIQNARKMLHTKAKTYYSNEALNPRPKRGRPPKQAAKLEIEPQISTDIYTTVPLEVRPFLFIPDYANASSSVLFSSKFESEEEMLASRRPQASTATDSTLADLNQKLASLRSLSSRWVENEEKKKGAPPSPAKKPPLKVDIKEEEFEEEEFDVELEEEDEEEIGLSEINGQKEVQKPSPMPAPSYKPVQKPNKKLIKPVIATKTIQPKANKALTTFGKPKPQIKSKQPAYNKALKVKAEPKLKPKPKPIPKAKGNVKKFPKKQPLRTIIKKPKKLMKKVLPLKKKAPQAKKKKPLGKRR